MVGGGSFRLPHDLFCSTLSYSIHFSSPVTSCFKNGTFSLRLSRELHVEIWSRRFFCLTYVEPKHQSDEHNQAGANDFQCLIWIFWVCRLSPAWYNVDCSQFMSRFDRYQLQLVYPTVEHRLERNLQHETSQTTFDVFSHSISPYTAQISFLCFSFVSTFLEIINHNMLKMFSSIFNFKMATQKFNNFFFLAPLGLHCCMWAFSSCREGGATLRCREQRLLFIVVHGFLLMRSMGFSCYGMWTQ